MIYDQVAQPDGQPGDQLYRLYRHAWVVAEFLIEPAGRPVDERSGWDVYDQCFSADVPRDRARVGVLGGPGTCTVILELLLPCCAGEFRWAFLARRHARDHGWDDVEVVVKESAADKALMAASHGLLARTGR